VKLEADFQHWLYKKRAETAAKNLRKNSFEALYVKDAKAAYEEILRRIPAGACIGLGDSVTLHEIGVIGELENGNYNFLNPWKKGITRAESLSLRRQALTSDIFLTGTNAVTTDGKLVSIDGLGNRVAGMIFGPLKVVVATGANKIVANVEEAIDRIKKIAAPVNARRHDFDPSLRPPCADTGFCSDCKPPRRICCKTAIIEGCWDKERICVLIIGESLGY
jgi:L-lactate utilization protein LutB